MNTNIIYNIDCMDGFKNIPDDSIDLILTDIPYNEVNRKSNGLRNLNKEEADIITFNLQDFLKECNRICRGSFYIFCGFTQVSEIDIYFKQNKISDRVIVWEKTNPSPMNAQSIWLSSVELCVYGKKSKATFNAFYKSPVLRYKVARNKRHKTEKNLDLFRELIKVSTNEGDVVLDPCIGSGTTAEAAILEKRKYIGFELNSHNYKISIDRTKTYE